MRAWMAPFLTMHIVILYYRRFELHINGVWTVFSCSQTAKFSRKYEGDFHYFQKYRFITHDHKAPWNLSLFLSLKLYAYDWFTNNKTVLNLLVMYALCISVCMHSIYNYVYLYEYFVYCYLCGVVAGHVQYCNVCKMIELFFWHAPHSEHWLK